MKKRIVRKISAIVSSIIVVVLIGGLLISPHMFRHTDIVTITDKQVKRNNSKDEYLIFTKNSNEEKVFKDSDSTLELKFNSSDIYGELQINHKYKIYSYGFRIPIFSTYENITKISKVK